MEVANKLAIFLAAISSVAVLVWAFGFNSLKYTTASLLTVPIQQGKNVVSSKVVTGNQIIAVDAPALEPEHINTPTPMRLQIPEINVDAKIDPMGVTKDGAMESPRSSQDVGWFVF